MAQTFNNTTSPPTTLLGHVAGVPRQLALQDSLTLRQVAISLDVTGAGTPFELSHGQVYFLSVDHSGATANLTLGQNDAGTFAVRSTGNVTLSTAGTLSAVAATTVSLGAQNSAINLGASGGVSTANLYGNLVVSGDLTIQGDTITTEISTLSVNDNVILVNSAPGAVRDAGFFAELHPTDWSPTVTRTNTLVSATATTAVLDAGASGADDTYNDETLYIVSGTGAGQSKNIDDYVGSTKTATVTTWDTTPDNTSVFAISASAPVNRFQGLIYDTSDAGFGSDVGAWTLVQSASNPATGGNVTVNAQTAMRLDGLLHGSDGTAANDVIFYSGTAGDNLTWDSSAAKLILTGTNGTDALNVADGNVSIVYGLDVDGATTLDQVTINPTDGVFQVAGGGSIDFDVAMDLSATLTMSATSAAITHSGGTGLAITSTSGYVAVGNAQFTTGAGIAIIGVAADTDLLTLGSASATLLGTLTVGVDDTGYDVKFFGATSGAYMLWDESVDQLYLAGAAGLTFNPAGVIITDILDEDNMASNSAVALATQQSIKAYVDSQTASGFTVTDGTNPFTVSGGDTWTISGGEGLTTDTSVADTLTITLDASNSVQTAWTGASHSVDTAGAISLDSTHTASNFTLTANDIGLAVLTIAASNAGAGVADIDIDADGKIEIDSVGVLNLESSAAISIGADAVAQAVNIATGAAARVITIGNAASASMTLEAGVGGFVLNADTTFDLNTAGAITLDSTGNAFGAGAEISLDAAGASNFTTSAGALTLEGAGGVTVTSTGGTLALNGTGQTVNLNSAALNVTASGAITTTGVGNSSWGTTSGNLTLSTTTSGDIVVSPTGAFDVNATGAATVDAASVTLTTAAEGAITLNASGAINIDGTTVDINSTGALKIGDDVATLDFDGAGAVSETGMTTFSLTPSSTCDIDSVGALTLDSSAAISIGADAVAQAVNIATGAAARVITIGNAASASLKLEGGVGGIDIDCDTTFDMLSGGAFNIQGTGASLINTASGDLTIGGGSGSLILTSGEGAADAVRINASLFPGAGVDIDANTGGVDIYTTGGFSIDGLQASNVSVLNAALSIQTLTSGVLTVSSAGNLVQSGAVVTIDATAGMSLDAAGASNFSTSSGSMTIAGTTTLSLTAGTDATITVPQDLILAVAGRVVTETTLETSEAGVTDGDLLAVTADDSGGATELVRADANSHNFICGVACQTVGGTSGAGDTVEFTGLPGHLVTVSTTLSAIANGTVLYLSETAGKVTATAPSTAGAHVIRVGVVANKTLDKILFQPQYMYQVAEA